MAFQIVLMAAGALAVFGSVLTLGGDPVSATMLAAAYSNALIGVFYSVDSLGEKLKDRQNSQGKDGSNGLR